MKFRHALSLIAALLSLSAFSPSAHAGPTAGTIVARPALWMVHGTNGTAYLLGSIHLLPPGLVWHTKAIDDALAASDVFVFEAPTDAGGQKDAQEFIAAHGLLPPGETLPHLLPQSALGDYANALQAAHVPAEVLADKQPWLASLILQVQMMEVDHYDPSSGIDRQVFDYATAHKDNVRYFETVQQQLALLAPPDEALAAREFAVELKSFHDERGDIAALVRAWASGDQHAIDTLMNSELAKDPAAKKALLDDRNAAFVEKLSAMLGEKHTFFITVGAAHLAGPGGVPALLRAKGYTVDGP